MFRILHFVIRVLLYGLGPIGVMVGRQLAARDGFRIVSAVDVDPAKVGRDLAEIADLPRPTRVKVSPDPQLAIRQTKPDVAVICTSSSARAVRAQIDGLLAAKVAIVTTTEELSFPVRHNAPLAKAIDARAKKAGVAIVATGVNPGFVMDTLPITLTAACERVDSVSADRVQDARTRRLPFQQKIGAGLSPNQFQRELERGTIRHVGFAESISMIASALGWRLDRIADEVMPKIAEDTVSSEFLAVDRGFVSGIVQNAVGYRHGTAVISLHMEAYLGAPDPYDEVRIEGVPRLTMRIPGGIPGDVATASIVVNSIPRVLASPPGLRTMKDLPVPSYYSGR
jgi:4-hydroxy-tetrahydrodipicolinate reductase